MQIVMSDRMCQICEIIDVNICGVSGGLKWSNSCIQQICDGVNKGFVK